MGGTEAPQRPSYLDMQNVVIALLLLSLGGQDNLNSYDVSTCNDALQEPVEQPESTIQDLVGEMQLTQRMCRGQA